MTVTIATYTYSHEARLAQTLLADAGLEPRLSDDHVVDAHPFISNAIGGVKLTVPTAHEAEARELLGHLPPAAARRNGAGWTALAVLTLGPLALVVLPISWIWGRAGTSPEA